MKLMLDQNLSHRIAHALAALVEQDGHTIRALKDRFDPMTADTDWIASLGAEGGWCVLSGDHRILRNPAEVAAWRRSSLIGFFPSRGWRKLSLLRKAARLLTLWPVIEQTEAISAPGNCYELPLKTNRLRQLNY